MRALMLVAAVACWGHGATAIARSLAPSGARGVTAACAAAVGWFAALSTALLLGLAGLLRAPFVAAAAVAFALGARYASRRTPARRERAGDPPRGLAPLALPALLAAPHLARAMAAPPRAWDALTYHLPRAANWAQDGAIVPRIAPDAGRYYEFFPPGGDLAFALAFLAGYGDAPLFVVHLATTAAVLLSSYALSRSLGARALAASLVAAFVGVSPCVLHLTASAYVDNAALAATLLALAFAVRAGGDDAPEGCVAAGLLAAGVAASIKSSGVSTLALCALLAGHQWWRGRVRGRVVLSALALALLPLAAWSLYAWSATGSPTYPFGVRLAGVELAHGNELLRRTFEATLPSWRERPDLLAELGRQLFWGRGHRGYPHVNLGYGGAVVGVAGLGALALMRATLPSARLLLLAAAALPIAAVLSPSMVALRTVWVGSAGRFLSQPLAVLACAVVAAWPRAGCACLAAAIAAQCAHAAPVGLPLSDLALGVAPIALAAAWVALVAAPLAVRPWSVPSRAALALALASTPLWLHWIERARAPLRGRYYEALSRGASFEVHPVTVGDWLHVWRALDAPRPERIAVTRGFTPPGHNWLLYPLYGGRLQNRVEYVAATCDGAVLDSALRPPPPAAFDVGCYLARLRRRGITALVLGPPPPPEARLIEQSSAHFITHPIGTARRFVLLRPAWTHR